MWEQQPGVSGTLGDSPQGASPSPSHHKPALQEPHSTSQRAVTNSWEQTREALPTDALEEGHTWDLAKLLSQTSTPRQPAPGIPCEDHMVPPTTTAFCRQEGTERWQGEGSSQKRTTVQGVRTRPSGLLSAAWGLGRQLRPWWAPLCSPSCQAPRPGPLGPPRPSQAGGKSPAQLLETLRLPGREATGHHCEAARSATPLAPKTTPLTPPGPRSSALQRRCSLKPQGAEPLPTLGHPESTRASKSGGLDSAPGSSHCRGASF